MFSVEMNPEDGDRHTHTHTHKLGFYIPEDDIVQGHHSENLKSYMLVIVKATVVSRRSFMCMVIENDTFRTHCKGQ
jgi:hypothetical protein